MPIFNAFQAAQLPLMIGEVLLDIEQHIEATVM